MEIIINGKVQQSQDIHSISVFLGQREVLSQKLLPFVYSLDAVNSLLLGFTAKLNEEEGRGATIDDYFNYSGMSIPALQARIRKLREEMTEGADVCFLAHEKDGLKYKHYSLFPYSFIQEINEKRGFTFDKHLGKYASKRKKNEPISSNAEIVQNPQESTETNHSIEEFDNVVDSPDEANQQVPTEKKEPIIEFFDSSNSIDSGKIVAVIFNEIVNLKKEITQLRQENQSLKDDFLKQQSSLLHLEQQLKEGTNKKIADALDQLLTFNQYTQ